MDESLRSFVMETTAGIALLVFGFTVAWSGVDPLRRILSVYVGAWGGVLVVLAVKRKQLFDKSKSDQLASETASASALPTSPTSAAAGEEGGLVEKIAGGKPLGFISLSVAPLVLATGGWISLIAFIPLYFSAVNAMRPNDEALAEMLAARRGKQAKQSTTAAQ